MPEQSFSEIWQSLRQEVENRNRLLQSRYESAFAELAATLQEEEGAVAREVMPRAAPGEISSISGLVEGPGTRLLFQPVRCFRKIRPQEKALDALESHEAGLDDLARRLPQTVDVTGAELVEAMVAWVPSRIGRYLLRRRDRVGFPLRRVVEHQFLEESAGRAELDGGLLLLLAHASLLLVSPWQDLRQFVLRHLAGQGVEEREWDRSRAAWMRRLNAGRELAARRLPALGAWTGGAVDRLAAAILRGRPADTQRGSKLLLRRQQDFRYWSRQQRAIIAVLDVEWELTEMLRETAALGADALASIDTEQAALLSELNTVIAWLEKAHRGSIEGDFPPPLARLVSAEDRVNAWLRLAEISARGHLPLDVETVEPVHIRPPRREPWKRLEPHKHFLSAVSRLGRPVVLEGFREVEGSHRIIVRVIERAREVVGFSLETARSGFEDSATVQREGLTNALSLVSYQRDSTADPHPVAERKLVQGLAGSFLLAHLSIEQRRLGLVNQLVRQSGSRAAQEIWKVILEQIANAGRHVRDLLRGRYHWALLKIGWEAAPIAIEAPIVARGYLGETLCLQLGARDLPMIYRRLFRLAPVEEPRFLVGRETEMTALAQARDLWRANRSVSVILVGDRGSGKTSLLNCAVAREFSDIEVIRSQFSERITSAPQMRDFLRRLTGIPAEQDLMEGLLARKRVIMLEELERTFLRRMNGFGGLQDLLSIVAGSSRTTLWVLAANQHSYRYLNAAVGLGQYFSHRINAMAIPPPHLKSAIGRLCAFFQP